MGLEDPTGVLVTGPTTSYVTPGMLLSAPTGISWSTIGASSGKPTPSEYFAEVADICTRASSMVNGMCNSTLKATVDSEVLTGPGEFRFQLQRNGRARFLLSRLPVLSVIGGQWTPAAAFPPQFTAIPANQFRVERPVVGTTGSTAPNGSGDGGQSVVMAPGIVTWAFGRMAFDVQISYINGWPHTSLTSSVQAGTSTLPVDDITGWVGAVGTIQDGGVQEAITITAVTPSVAGAITGPGTLTTSSPIVYQHPSGTLVSTLSESIIQATILLCVSQALVRGATATTVQALPGSRLNSNSSPSALVDEAKRILQPYRRVI